MSFFRSLWSFFTDPILSAYEAAKDWMNDLLDGADRFTDAVTDEVVDVAYSIDSGLGQVVESLSDEFDFQVDNATDFIENANSGTYTFAELSNFLVEDILDPELNNEALIYDLLVNSTEGTLEGQLDIIVEGFESLFT